MIGLTAPSADAASKKKRHKSTAIVSNKNGSVGGYSYRYEDAVVEFRDRTILRDPNLGMQGGPFDSGYFFDSNVTPYGSQAPYMN
jgi:hypothetical protein